MDCNNYLLSVPGKVFALLLLNRIRDHLILTQHPEQAGFTPKRSTIDWILALRVLIEHHLPWDLFRKRGIPAGILSLISALYSDTESAIKSGGGVSRFFRVKSGVRQGCVLAPTLFNTCIDWIMGEMVGKIDCGISFGEAMITDLDFAVVRVIFAEVLLDQDLDPKIRCLLRRKHRSPASCCCARKTCLLC